MAKYSDESESKKKGTSGIIPPQIRNCRHPMCPPSCIRSLLMPSLLLKLLEIGMLGVALNMAIS